MHSFTVLFTILLAAGLVLRLWLLQRQVRAVRAHRDHVPAPFAGGTALVTVERGKLMTREVRTFATEREAIQPPWENPFKVSSECQTDGV